MFYTDEAMAKHLKSWIFLLESVMSIYQMHKYDNSVCRTCFKFMSMYNQLLQQRLLPFDSFILSFQ